MDVARLNLSHGSYADHEAVYAAVREASDDHRPRRRDLGGPAGSQDPHDQVRGRPRTRSTATASPSPPRRGRAPDLVGTTYKGLPGDVAPRRHLLIDDGKVEGRRRGHRHRCRDCEVVVAGTVSNNKGINLPGVAVSVPACRRRTRRPALGPAPAGRLHRAVVRAQRRGHAGCTRSWTRRAFACPSSPRSRSLRPSPTSRRSSRPSMRSWWPVATSASNCRLSRCRWCKSSPSRSPGATPSRSSSPRKCWSR
jgi:hypothetical protein